MNRNRFKDPALRKIYAACREYGNDRTSSFYINGHPHRGAGHRAAYWNGRSGLPRCYVQKTMLYACWAAGRDDRKEYGPVPFSKYGQHPPHLPNRSTLALRMPVSEGRTSLFVPLKQVKSSAGTE